MHNSILIPGWLMVVFILLAWLGVVYFYVFKPHLKPRMDDYFAIRRHNRRIRNYANGRTLYDVNTIRKPEVYFAPARHRR